ncbi:AB hydrolase superfamily protein [Fulvia fulva]|nr:AB hydrolase superfamily protein [Fulvia fulva]KAK4611203.1 AB hydrolase superfamily protein [Fulvia fulva]WPV22280.1 AB hydrolase superfamily protein [Fulvia fulva]WPV37048.1 AB hydrolase superfamily protein [Fulvia fulva]
MENTRLTAEDHGLPCDSVNESNDQTVLLIHGTFGSRDDWDLVIPHLTTYHLLIPDLPSHGEAQHLKPFSGDYAADLIVTLIATKAHGSRAHVVGWSLGASIAISLASRHPTVVDSMIMTGYGRLPRTRFTPYLAYALWTEQRIESMMPRSVIRWLTDGADLKPADTKVMTIELNKQIFVDGLSDDAWPSPWPAKTLIIAATKRGIMPTDDNADIARKLAAIGSQKNKETSAVAHPGIPLQTRPQIYFALNQHIQPHYTCSRYKDAAGREQADFGETLTESRCKGMRHPWPRQSPVLFAETVRCFLAERDLPGGFQQL